MAQELDNLVAKHPFLNEVETMTVGEAGLSFEEMSAFIERCWKHDYGDEPRIIFSPELLNADFQDGLEGSFVCVHDSEIVGAVMVSLADIVVEGNEYLSGISSALSVHSEFRGNGIAQLIGATQNQKLKQMGVAANYYWLDSRHSAPGKSFRVFGRKQQYKKNQLNVPIYGKSLDYQRSVEIGDVNLLEKVGIKMVDILFGQRKESLFGHHLGFIIEEEPQEVADFLNEFQDRSIRRVFKASNIMKKLSAYETNPYQDVVIRKGDQICAVFSGIVNRKRDDVRNAYYQMDAAVFHPDMSYAAKKDCFALAEHHIKTDLRCFSVAAPATAFSENPIKYGYIPHMKQTLIYSNFGNISINNDKLSKAMVFLR